MRAIGELSGQEYVDMYAQQAKEKLAAGAPHLEASSPLPGTAPAPLGTPAETPPGTAPAAPGTPAETPPGTAPAPLGTPAETPPGTRA